MRAKNKLCPQENEYKLIIIHIYFRYKGPKQLSVECGV